MSVHSDQPNSVRSTNLVDLYGEKMQRDHSWEIGLPVPARSVDENKQQATWILFDFRQAINDQSMVIQLTSDCPNNSE